MSVCTRSENFNIPVAWVAVIILRFIFLCLLSLLPRNSYALWFHLTKIQTLWNWDVIWPVTSCDFPPGFQSINQFKTPLPYGELLLLSLHKFVNPWWRHQMETSSALLDLCEGNPPVTGGFPLQRPVMWSVDVFFDLRLNKRLSKQSRRRWFETSSRSLCRHCNGWL